MEVVADCLSKETGYGLDIYTTENCSVQYFEANHQSPLRIEYPDKFQISPECLTMIYFKFLDEVPALEAKSERSKDSKRKRGKSFDLHSCTDWWKGRSDFSKKLLLKQVFEKDIGLDISPPFFDRGCLASAIRQEKIKASNLRIQKIMHPLVPDAGDGNDICASKHIKSGKKQVDIDWEDLIIETLLLHNVKEDEIEKGHYNVLLDLHVFDYGNV